MLDSVLKLAMLDKSHPFETNMTYPMPYYLINTSYYTYLKINPESGELEGSAENYKKYLLKGVRCIDIELIVYEWINI